MIRRLDFAILAGGVVLGVILGLIYAWLIDPVELVNTTPDMLRFDHRHEWIRLVALSYAADGDLQRAETRLEPLEEDDVEEALVALIEAYAAQGRPAETMRALSGLADHLGVYTPAMDVYLSTSAVTPPPASPTPPGPPTPAPTTPPPTVLPATETPIVLATTSPVPTPIASPYRVLTRTAVCTGTASQLQVLVWSAPEELDEEEGDEEVPQRLPLPGVALWLTWPGGADRAVTGLRPWLDPGYADFELEPEVSYALSIDEPNAPVLSGLTAPVCPTAEQPGSWRIVVEVNDRL